MVAGCRVVGWRLHSWTSTWASTWVYVNIACNDDDDDDDDRHVSSTLVVSATLLLPAQAPRSVTMPGCPQAGMLVLHS